MQGMRFYMNLFNGHGDTTDKEGQDFAGPAQARISAITEIRELIASDICEGQIIVLSHYISICDAAGNESDRVFFRDAVTFQAD